MILKYLVTCFNLCINEKLEKFTEAIFKYTNYKLNRLYGLHVMQGTIFRKGDHVSSYFTKK